MISDHESLPIPLVRRVSRPAPAPAYRQAEVQEIETERDIDPDLRRRASAELQDRMSPGTAGALAGLVAGAVGLGVVHGLEPLALSQVFAKVSAQWGIGHEAAIGAAYGAAALGGAVVGAGFGAVTRHLRRFLPLVLWAVVFFTSLTMLILAISRTYGSGRGVALAPALLAATAAFAVVAAFQLPLRKRG